ncbi:hypothetical protein [Sphingobacterium sp. Ag1]|uniref:hypothetical protein n=1 Tax=Sphingobacterium sp. Ag1 TaxID=1643451 RepID=UPI000627DFBC|nr:hypothetical protein [Sphingobacterium sp. Ag1]
MEIKSKLSLILKRIKLVLKKDIKTNYSDDYAKGFQHAALLFQVAMDKEFGKYVQIEENKSLIIREKESEIEQLSVLLLSKQRHIDHLETILEKASFDSLSASKMTKVINLIAFATGQSTKVVRGKLSDILEGKVVKNG